MVAQAPQLRTPPLTISDTRTNTFLRRRPASAAGVARRGLKGPVFRASIERHRSCSFREPRGLRGRAGAATVPRRVQSQEGLTMRMSALVMPLVFALTVGIA